MRRRAARHRGVLEAPGRPTVRQCAGMIERLTRLRPPFQDPHRQALHAALVGGRRGAGPQAFDLTAPDGSLVGPFGLMLQAPHLGGPLEALGAAVRFETGLTERVREVAILAVAVATDSGFEVWAHERVGRLAGLSEAELAGIRQGTFGAGDGVDPTEAMAHDLAVRLAERRPLDDEVYAAAVARLGEHGLLELVVLVGYYALLAQLMDVFGVEAPDAGEAAGGG
jgi:4-carboxymuconolactone decarboxylase